LFGYQIGLKGGWDSPVTQLLCKPEICEDQMAVLLQQQIFRFQIPEEAAVVLVHRQKVGKVLVAEWLRGVTT